MRIWSLHPRYLDAKGLVALWREALLAQAVLRGRTKGYRHHPQLARFREQPEPAGAIAAYLRGVLAEAEERNYRFDGSRIAPGPEPAPASMTVARGQLLHEWAHLGAKLAERDRERAAQNAAVAEPAPHPLFRVVAGGVAAWEADAGRR